MQVTVLCFGMLKDLLGDASRSIELPEGESVAGLLRLFDADSSNRNPVWSCLAVAVNREYASPQNVLRDGDEVALLPPVSGGAGGASVCG